ncbi:hypothetical protein GPECTOR_34g779 [Gonium pectorale]|uniref:Protein kinase domain-containing protein n=1 Tax=Gonium pectorale TaxID=33097 RepID=A0A150GE46_GONPE|nr:hypothetical protein GPECTOR_34g779 [Gonium pectorale]|eukprot:KXZ47620.1 hypothetical protein GPECTOR_34g779 [Gonium pectorale]
MPEECTLSPEADPEEPWVPKPKERLAPVLLVDPGDGRPSRNELGDFCESLLLSMQMRLKVDAELSTFRLASGASSRYLTGLSMGHAGAMGCSALLSFTPISANQQPGQSELYVGSFGGREPGTGRVSPIPQNRSRLASEAPIELRLCRSVQELVDGLSELRLLRPPQRNAWQEQMGDSGSTGTSAGAQEAAPQPGARQLGGPAVGRWVIGDSAAGGGKYRSVILEGRWQGQPVAVKLVAGQGLEARSAAVGSALAAAAVLHPNLVRVHGMRLLPPAAADVRRAESNPTAPLKRLGGLAATARSGVPEEALAKLARRSGEGVLAVVMERCETGSLLPLVSAMYSPFRPNRAWPAYLARRALLRTALEIAGALGHLHRLGLVHGALRPSNVLLVPALKDRRTFFVKISDVGLSCSTLAEGLLMPAAADTAGPMALLGLDPDLSPPSAAPACHDPADDVRAFGLLLWELASGELDSGEVSAERGDGGCPVWPNGAHPHLRALYDACVHADPQERPGMDQVCAELAGLDDALRRERPRTRAAAAAGYAALAAGRETPGLRLPGFLL